MNPAIGSIDTSGLPHEWKGIIATTPIKESSFEPYKRKRAEPPLSHSTCSYNEPAAIHNDILNSTILLFRNKKQKEKKYTFMFLCFSTMYVEMKLVFEYLIIRK